MIPEPGCTIVLQYAIWNYYNHKNLVFSKMILKCENCIESWISPTLIGCYLYMCPGLKGIIISTYAERIMKKNWIKVSTVSWSWSQAVQLSYSIPYDRYFWPKHIGLFKAYTKYTWLHVSIYCPGIGTYNQIFRKELSLREFPLHFFKKRGYFFYKRSWCF